MTNQEIVLSAMRSQGKADALSLRNRAPDMDGTALIAEEEKVPSFDPQKDYSGWPVGAPVADEGQVWTLLAPYNAGQYAPHRPSTLRSQWGLAHTKDPHKAKPWVPSYGISGMYKLGECYKDADGTVYRQIYDGDNEYPASALPERWEVVLVK